MKGYWLCLLVVGFLAAVPARGATRLEAGVSIGPEGLRGFHLAVSDYFKVPEPEVVVWKQKRVADEELPVVFFLAQRARVAPAAIVDLRLAGKSWMDIVVHYKLGTDVFQVNATKVDGPPYGRAYGYWRKRGANPPARLILKDSEVVDLVNLRFLSEHHRCAADDVIAARSRGAGFVAINEDLGKKHKPGKPDRRDDDDRGSHGKGKHHGKGK
jgi:hypothetical protein